MSTKDHRRPQIRTWTDGRLEVSLETVPIEPLSSQGGGPGWGSTLLLSPQQSAVYWSRAYGQTPKPWSALDLPGLTIRTTSRRADGLHGDLRDAILGVDGQHAWMLLTHGFAKVDLENMREVELLRHGLPTYLWRVHDLGGTLFGVTGWTSNTVLVIDRGTLEIVRTVRTPSPDLVLKGSVDDELEFFAFNAGVRRTWSGLKRSLGLRRSLPVGTGPFYSDGHVWFVEGARDPSVPARVRTIVGERVALLDVASGNVIKRGPLLDEPLRVIGIDGDGRILVRCRFGLDVLDPVDLRPIVRVRQEFNSFGPIVLLPDGQSAVGADSAIDPRRFVVIRWRPSRPDELS